MPLDTGLSRVGRTFIVVVIAGGFSVIAVSLLHLYWVPVGAQWLLLALLTLISGSACIELPHSNVTISISEAFVFAAVLLYGPAAGTLTVALDGLVISYWIARRRPELERALFNVAAPALSAWLSANLFFAVSGIAPLSERAASLDQILPALLLYALAYFALNSSLIAFRIALDRRAKAFEVWRSNFMWLSLNYFCGASVAILLVGNNRTIDIRFVGVVVPLLLVLYFTFKTSMERVEDAYRHVDQINQLYLSTIETLAMAIDAKDQITHGHIRRVQTYAVGLAKRVGVTENKLIKAIEAAALLHDTGKLAIPEYILNKPGKLSPVEFEKMKEHAGIGAEILSAIDFPYPVIPIVRHHHENWDGTGYPDRLRGTDIPIGARILAVVDCFDALTSDRPYRARLSNVAALQILRDRRGTMYDPIVVDTFARVYREIGPPAMTTGPAQHVLDEITTGTQIAASQRGATIGDPSSQPSEASQLRSNLFARTIGMSEAEIEADLREAIRFSLGVVFLNDGATNELEAAYVFGEGSQFVRGFRIPLGQRLSGWVAVNRQTISNSDARLDLGDDIASATGMRGCLSTPLISKDHVVGVMSVYSTADDGFAEADRRAIEGVAQRVIGQGRRKDRLPA